MSDERDPLRQLLFPKRRRRPGRWAWDEKPDPPGKSWDEVPEEPGSWDETPPP
jgi:hypothetical protein